VAVQIRSSDRAPKRTRPPPPAHAVWKRHCNSRGGPGDVGQLEPGAALPGPFVSGGPSRRAASSKTAVVEDRFCAAGGHIYQMIVNHDYAANNVGLLLFSDIAINSVGLILVIWHAIACKRETGTTDSKVIARPAHV